MYLYFICILHNLWLFILGSLILSGFFQDPHTAVKGKCDFPPHSPSYKHISVKITSTEVKKKLVKLVSENRFYQFLT